MENKFVLDGFIKSDVETNADGHVIFMLSSKTGDVVSPDGSVRPRYTHIKAKYFGGDKDITSKIVAGNHVRITGRLDSEQLLSKSNKTVYNKYIEVQGIEAI